MIVVSTGLRFWKVDGVQIGGYSMENARLIRAEVAGMHINTKRELLRVQEFNWLRVSSENISFINSVLDEILIGTAGKK